MGEGSKCALSSDHKLGSSSWTSRFCTVSTSFCFLLVFFPKRIQKTSFSLLLWSPVFHSCSVCAPLAHMQCCARDCVLCHMYAWSLPARYQDIFCIPMSSLVDQSVGSVLSTACAFSWPNCSWVAEYQLSLAVVTYEHGDPECLFSVWH